MEYFYREVRRRLDVLMDGRKPAGGTWNYDARNREPLPRQGPESIPQPAAFRPDKITREVIALVNERFADHPGRCDAFDWPVTPEKAREALEDFIQHRLDRFGPYQDAMWTGQPLLYHSRLSSAMNLHLLDPRDVVAAAERAYDSGVAPIHSVEGFIRQVIGWREYVRGVYWRLMPDYLDRNALAAHAPLPAFYWTGETDLHCVACCVGQTLDRGYAHHIQRLMVTGLLALLADVDPVEVHKWYLAVYVDAVEWVELPNTLGMSQFADNGIMASKPYAASGKYIDRMSNYCRDCRYDPSQRTGESACPFTTLYWDFLLRHRQKLSSLPRMGFQLKNADRIAPADARAIRRQADQIKSRLAGT
jgi:deoxyribodipyrimidine photolyase-related protein